MDAMAKQRRVWRLSILLTTVVITSVVAFVLSLAGTPDRIALSSLPEGVSAREVNGRQVFVVRDGDRVTGFLRASPRGFTMLVWCPRDDVFLAPAYGETFDRLGRLIRDVSPRDMDRIKIRVRGDQVQADPRTVTRGVSNLDERGHLVRDLVALGEWSALHSGREPPVDYCDSPTP